MKYYKEVLLKKLVICGWELVSQDDQVDWWAEEVWIIQSAKQSWGLQLFIHFLVDPQYDGDDKSSAVWLVTLNSSVARDYTEAQNGLADFRLQKGQINENIRGFVETINAYRDRVAEWPAE